MNMRTIPAVLAGAVLAVGLLGACSSQTSPETPATTAPTVSDTASTQATATATDTASAEPTAEDTGTPAVAQPSALTLTVADGKATGKLVVKGTDQGVGGAEVSLVFRPTGGGDPQIETVTTGDDGSFTSTASASGAGTWTASFLGSASAGAAVASTQAS